MRFLRTPQPKLQRRASAACFELFPMRVLPITVFMQLDRMLSYEELESHLVKVEPWMVISGLRPSARGEEPSRPSSAGLSVGIRRSASPTPRSKRKQPDSPDALEEGSLSQSTQEDGKRSPADAGVGIVGSAMQHKNKREQNPFVEYEDRQQRLQDQRRWLQEDPVYLEERMKTLQAETTQTILSNSSKHPDDLYEEAVYHGSYSVKVRQNMSAKVKRWQSEIERSHSVGASLPSIDKKWNVMQPDAQQQAPKSDAAVKRAERNPQNPCVKLLRSMQNELESSWWIPQDPEQRAEVAAWRSSREADSNQERQDQQKELLKDFQKRFSLLKS